MTVDGGSVAQISLWTGFPFPRTDSSHGFRDRYAERGEAVQDSDTDLEFDNLTVEVPSGQALAQQFRFAVLRFKQCILVSTRLRR